MEITRDYFVFVRNIRNRLSTEFDTKLNRVSKFLLLNINLTGCMYQNRDDIFQEIFDILLENEKLPDLRMFNKLYRRVTKDFIEIQAEKIQKDEVWPIGYTSQDVKLYQDFPNLFQFCYLDRARSRDDCVDFDLARVEGTADMSCNLYMVLENIENLNVTKSVLERLPGLWREKGWGPVLPKFISSLEDISDVSKQLLRSVDI